MRTKYFLIPQEDALGCGIACIAVALGISYGSVVRKIPKEKYSIYQERGLYCRDIVSVFKLFGVKDSWSKVTDKNVDLIYNEGNIIYMNDDDHYVIAVKNGWHDSWINWPKMNPVKAGIIEQLPEKPSYIVVLKK